MSAKETPMRRSVFIQLSALCIASLLAAAPVLAQGQATVGQAPDIKAMLLGTPTWRADWKGPSDSGVTEIMFEARGDKVVAKLRNITLSQGCERDVTITTGVVSFGGCNVKDVTLRFDPNDREYPFKGKSAADYEWKLKRK
jgi:hypothetical protein